MKWRYPCSSAARERVSLDAGRRSGRTGARRRRGVGQGRRRGHRPGNLAGRSGADLPRVLHPRRRRYRARVRLQLSRVPAHQDARLAAVFGGRRADLRHLPRAQRRLDRSATTSTTSLACPWSGGRRGLEESNPAPPRPDAVAQLRQHHPPVRAAAEPAVVEQLDPDVRRADRTTCGRGFRSSSSHTGSSGP